MEACLIVTYRCNARCVMCDTWKNPSKASREFSPALLEKLPDGLRFINVTGGEPFMRSDLEEIVEAALGKTERLVISTNGYYTDKILALAGRFGNRVGVRISLEGLSEANDAVRGLSGGFDHAMRTLLGLLRLGMKDVGFGLTVSDRNAADMRELYALADAMQVEFATAVTHNSYYFHKHDNAIENVEAVAAAFEALAREMLSSRSPKKWFRAYFNMGLANRVRGGARPLPCEAGKDMFFLTPTGDVTPCNGSREPMIMGNLHEASFEEIWQGEQAERIRAQVGACDRQCWMIGTAAPAMKKRLRVPLAWVLRHKLRALRGKADFALEPVCRPGGKRA